MASQEYDDFGNLLYENQPWEKALPYNPARRDEFGRLIFAYDDNLMEGRPRPGTEHAYFRDKGGGWIRREALNGATPESLGLRPATRPLNPLNLNSQAQEVPPFADGIAPLEQEQMDRDIAGGPLLRFDEDLYDGRPRPGAEHLYEQDRNGNWIKSGGLEEKDMWRGVMPSSIMEKRGDFWDGELPSVPRDGRSRPIQTLEMRDTDPRGYIALMIQKQEGASGEEQPAQPKKSERDDPNQRHLYEDITEKDYQPDGHTFTPNEPPYKPTHEDIRLNPGRSVMPNSPQYLPPQMNIFANMAEIMHVRSKPLHDRLLWFYNKVKDGGEWDYKRKNKKYPSKWEDAGNYHYGFAGTILGIPPELLKRAAGGGLICGAPPRDIGTA